MDSSEVCVAVSGKAQPRRYVRGQTTSFPPPQDLGGIATTLANKSSEVEPSLVIRRKFITLTVYIGFMANLLADKIRQLVGRNQLLEAAQLLSNSPFRNEGIIQLSKVQALTDAIRQGTIRAEEKDVQSNQLKKGLLDIADNIEVEKGSSTIFLNEVPGLSIELVGRRKDMESLHKELTKDKPILLLNGLGGIGKTTLAKAYIQTYHQEFDHILWVNANTSIENQENSMVFALADDHILHQSLGIPFEADLSPENRLKVVLHRLRNLDGKNLMILDNTNQLAQHIIPQLPTSSSWKIILTSREEMEGVHTIRLDELSPEDAEELFYHHYPKGRSYEADVKELLQVIGYHTLSIELLARSCKKGKIKKLTPRVILDKIRQKQFDTIQKKVFSQHSEREIELFSYLLVAFDLSNLTEDEEHVLRQWSILPSIDIDGELVIQLFNYDEDAVPDSFELAIEGLVQKGWLLYDEMGETFRCHQLIQKVIYYQLEPDANNCAELIQGVSNLLVYDESYGNPVHSFPYVVFGESILKAIESIEKRSNLSSLLAKVYQNLGRYQEAEILLQLTLQSRIINLGEDHPDVTKDRSDLASIYQDLGRYQEAESLHQLALQSRIINLGEDHPDVATSRSLLASSYQYLGKYQEAESLHQLALKSRIINLGEGHPDVAASRSKLAGVYEVLGRYQEAESLHQLALQSYTTNLGEDHPNVASSRADLANTYQDLGRYQEAESLHQLALESMIFNLGEDHPNIAVSRSNLASVYQDLGRYQEAENLLQLALQSYVINLGEDHPYVATIRSYLARVYQDLGRYQEAENLLQLALQSRIINLGETHPSVATSRSNLASVYQDLGRYQEAESLFQLALQSRITKLGVNHPDVATSRSNLASVYQDLGRYQEAENLLQLALQSYIINLGEDHPYIAISRSNLARAYQDLSKYHEAESLHQLALQSYITNLGEDHPYIAISRSNLASVYQDLGKYQEAESLHRLALKAHITNLGEDHPYVAVSRSNLARVYQDLGRYQEAESLLQMAIQSHITNLGGDHPYVASSQSHLASIYRATGRHQEAEELLKK